jgi:uncharacterized protein YndB with AHSA1/START domain
MKPITVSTTVAKPVAEVYEHLDVLANHEAFTDHMLVDWSLSGPAKGVGSKARVRANAPGKKQWTEITVVDAEPPRRIVERSVGAGGRRMTQGTYELEPEGVDRTRVNFTFEYLEAPAPERIMAPLLRLWLRHGNQKAMDRLAEIL